MDGHVIKLSDKKFGRLLVKEYKGIGLDRYARWLFLCDCGKTSIVRGVSLKRGHTKSCGCSWRPRGKNSKLWRGYGEISGLYWRNIITSARQRNIPLNITIENMWELFLKQKQCCAVTGVPLKFAQGKEDYINCTASLDRIDSSKRYTNNNVRWVHKTVNQIKWELSDDELIKWCKLILHIETIK